MPKIDLSVCIDFERGLVEYKAARNGQSEELTGMLGEWYRGNFEGANFTDAFTTHLNYRAQHCNVSPEEFVRKMFEGNPEPEVIMRNFTGNALFKA